MSSRRLLAAGVAAAAVLALVAAAPEASAAPPRERVVLDTVDEEAPYDIVRTTLVAAPKPGRKAKVVVTHDRQVRSGDGIDLWFDLDGDRAPDVYLTGMAFSEYAVFRARSFTRHGKDISDRNCFSLSMRKRHAVVRFRPDCLGPSRNFAVSARSFRHGEPVPSADWAPRTERLTRRVLSYATADPGA
ncbi:hypothetical protein [Nocardioides sp. W7]|uniref:hypothetical protein n=1 Tax=Nocardioides sp. W7 TaxID=2931390 RepID=UPI001FD2FA38|nr:hypothetical protein [Nocardioides sp. W7]